MLNRRRFMQAGLGIAAARAIGAPAIAQTRPKVVIIGAGAGGASVLRTLAVAAPRALDITLVEAQPAYSSCFYSNHYIGGFQDLDTLTFRFDAIRQLPGVTFANTTAEDIDTAARMVVLAGGKRLPYDVLVLSPGVDLDYNSVPGWSKEAEERMPHAWKAGQQLSLLRNQIDAAPEDALIVMLAPPLPYRCPPGPYERASMIAHRLKAQGKTKSRIVILDAKEVFSKQPLFQQGWEQHYPGMIEWLPPSIHGGIKQVDPQSMTVETGFETYSGAAVVNVIPRQTAGKIAHRAGLVDQKGYCPIDAFTMASKADPNILVVGDACIAGDMPKSAFAAHSQAQVAANTVRARLLGLTVSEAVYQNTCWSLIEDGDCVKIGGRYKPTSQKIQEASSFISKLDESAITRRENVDEAAAWFSSLTQELYS